MDHVMSGSPASAAARTPRRLRSMIIASVAPVLSLGCIALAQPSFAVQGLPGSKSSLAAEGTSAQPSGRIVVAGRLNVRPRLSSNGTRAPSEQNPAEAQPPTVTVEPPDSPEVAARKKMAQEAAAAAAEAIAAARQKAAAQSSTAAKDDDEEPYVKSTKLQPLGCLAGCLIPDLANARASAQPPAAVPSPTLGQIQTTTNSNGGGTSCIAGCYGSFMETTAATASAAPDADPAKSETRSITVLRGVTRKKIYPGKD